LLVLNSPRLLALAACLVFAACGKAASHSDVDAGPAAIPVTPVHAGAVDTRFVTADHMRAGLEMQLSGEPFAEAMNRDLTAYSRDNLTPDIYFDPSPQALGPWTDITGYSSAVESYEYSKQPMNNLSFESGAGVSLLFGPLVNPSGVTGDAAMALLAPQLQSYATQANTTSLVSWNQALPGGTSSPLGWPGFWPVTQPFRSFDPAITATDHIDWLCSITSDDTPGTTARVLNEDYECDYTTLHLKNRSAQIEAVLSPGAAGWSGWKAGLWTLNYLQVMHDSLEQPVDAVMATDLSSVGVGGNTVVGSSDGTPSEAGVFIGSSNIEGLQAAVMITEADNQAQQWLTSLTTTDGSAFSGFASIQEALEYDFAKPLRWFPEAIAVTEVDDTTGFPRPSSFQVSSSTSDLMGLSGLLGEYSEFYSLTDHANKDVGGSQGARVYFDGNPFAEDDQLANGEPTLHDRALAMMRVIVVNLDRLHRDPTSGLLVDQVSFQGATPTRGTTVSTSSVAYSLVALRNARRSLTSDLALYSNSTPDLAGAATPLDTLPFAGAPSDATFSARLTALMDAESDLLFDHLTTSDGHAFTGWRVDQGAALDTTDTLDAHAAAIRGLLTAYLSTGATKYRDRAKAVFNRMDAVFYDPSARLYADVPLPVTHVVYTPSRFSQLQSALRETYALIGSRPGEEDLGTLTLARVGRLNKLVLNGWDDRNGDNTVQWPDECIHVVDGLPRGGLQMAERSLTGELGSVDDVLSHASARVKTTDREHDCVPDVAAVGLPSALANSIDLMLEK
jgi:hypothetical protein